MIKTTKYTREKLEKLDKEIEMIPLTFDKQFKKTFEYNLNLLKRFLIVTLKLPIEDGECNIKTDDKEQIKHNHKEYQMIYDIAVIINEKTYIMVEMNSKYFKNIKERNSVYLDRKKVSLIEKGKTPEDYSDTLVYQLNLNPKEKGITQGEHVIVPYDLTTNTVFADNKIMVIKYLEYYKKLYYTYGNREEEIIWLAGLTAKTFTELYDIYSQVLTPEELDKLMEDVINMSKDYVPMCVWEKEKMDALVEYEIEKERREEPEEYRKKLEECREEIEERQQREEERHKHQLKDAKEKGIEQGIEQVVKKMLEENIDLETIIRGTGLTKSQIEALK